MKLVECLAELKLTEKKIAQKLQFIQKYAARPSFRDDAFGAKGGEAEKVREHVQACNDLISRHEALKRALDYSNLVLSTEVNGKPYTLHSLILHKRGLVRMKKAVYSALSDQQAQMEIATLRQRQGSDAKLNAQCVYNYDIQEREEKLSELTELESQVDSALQIANARLDLVEPNGTK